MNIEHRTTPIEHWIVDGKAYRMATEKDVGKEVYRTDAVNNIEHCIKPGTVPLTAYEPGHEKPYVCWCRWKYAYVQDDSLLESTEIEPGPTEEPTPKPIDWTKPVRTKDGRAVRVLCTDGPGEYPVVGFVNGDNDPRTWTLAGHYFVDGPDEELDLENVPSRIEREYWVNVYPEDAIAYSTKLRADETRASSCLACVKITIDCEEGEGL